MTVSTTLARQVTVGNGSTTAFPVVFTFDKSTDLTVTLVTTATGVEVLQVLTTNYTVAGGGFDTGTVTMIVAPPTGTELVVERSMPFIQGIDYVRNDPFPAETNEQGLDRGVMLTQQNLDSLSRAVQAPITRDPALAPLVVPEPVSGEFLRGRTDLTGFEGATITGAGLIGIPVSLAEGGTNATTAAAARTNLGSTTVGDAVFIATDAAAVRTAIDFDQAAWLARQLFG